MIGFIFIQSIKLAQNKSSHSINHNIVESKSKNWFAVERISKSTLPHSLCLGWLDAHYPPLTAVVSGCALYESSAPFNNHQASTHAEKTITPLSLARNIMKCAKSRKKALLKSARRSASALHGNWLGGPGGVTLVVSSAPRAPRRYPVHDKWGEPSHGKKERERRRRRPRHDPPTAPAAARVTRAREAEGIFERIRTHAANSRMYPALFDSIPCRFARAVSRTRALRKCWRRRDACESLFLRKLIVAAKRLMYDYTTSNHSQATVTEGKSRKSRYKDTYLINIIYKAI